ncbi:C-type lectin domain family 5 member A-like [Mytilus edulis]|uniref:C-type lectin domain family 5 member A-like n=1 Tax=Mytilus edulis TaxID=6550 RepID=UPI0039EFAD97
MLLLSLVLLIINTRPADANMGMTFQFIPDISILLSSQTSTFLCQKESNQRHDCFLQCFNIPECLSVLTTHESCYCNTDLTPNSTYHQSDTQLYVKRPANECMERGYIYHKGLCLRKSTTYMSWFDALNDCASSGGHLIVLDSLTKHTTVVDILNTYYHLPQFDDAYYVGASDISEEGNWKWISQNSSDFMTFKTNQPNNIDIHHPGLDADCAALRVTNRALVDEYCLQTKAYICEIN